MFSGSPNEPDVDPDLEDHPVAWQPREQPLGAAGLQGGVHGRAVPKLLHAQTCEHKPYCNEP